MTVGRTRDWAGVRRRERARSPGGSHDRRSAQFGFLLALIAAPIAGSIDSTALAAGPSEYASVAAIRANKGCIREEARITGFAIAREQSGASLMAPGYRVTEILVAEGDKVSADQELLRAVREDSGDAANAGAAGQRYPMPATMSVRAPIAGVVTRIAIRVGAISAAPQIPAPGALPDANVMIAGSGGVDLIVDVPSIYASQIRKGKQVRITSETGAQMTGQIRSLVSEIDPATQLGRARVAIEQAGALRPGQFASAVVETARECGVVVPRSAVGHASGEPVVQVLIGDTVETRKVRTGLFDNAKIQIRDGVAEGDAVITDAGAALRSGDRVKPLIADR